jgi:histidyl-tRNA synthetase
MASIKYKLTRGTKDFLSSEAFTASSLEEIARRFFVVYGYQEIRSPLIEDIGIFQRGLGDHTEIVERQIFRIQGKDNLCLRPEATAQVVRAYIERGLKERKLFKGFYIGPMFRGERPQKGRLRQFHHLGCEAIGCKSVFLDAEIIILAWKLILSLGIKKFTLEINSLGCKDDKERLVNLLRKYLAGKETGLCPSCRKRLDNNVLRVLDCKNPDCKKIVDKQKIGHKYLCSECRLYLEKLTLLLKQQNIDYKIKPTLVRGLDYYTDIVFEFVSSDLGAQSAIGAGGRYDNLVESLGGPSRPASGFALGLERLMLLRKNIQYPAPAVFIAYTSDLVQERAFSLLNLLRNEGISSDMDFSRASLKSQLRYCQKLGCKYAVIAGDQELKQDSVILRDMESSCQSLVKIGDLARNVQNRKE